MFGERLAPGAPTRAETARLCALAADRRGVADGHVAIEYVAAARITALNERHREKAEPTDVLSFPVDGVAEIGEGPADAPGHPRELGDVVICPAHTVDLREAIVHGMLHLLGMDHETDSGEMLALQDELLRQARQ
ncbi:MAG: putative rRNA maturation factor [Solirubrobacteraceae bacterium]|nr:rRNA maturation RNase YbeY [Solirubrobacterales bacterium]MEA2216238.1 putative rRNA maturation factor [Solirubrobacteraceae bacterium]